LTCIVQSHLSVYQKGAHYTGIKVFNRLPVPIKQLSHDTKQFKMALKGCLYNMYKLIDAIEFFCNLVLEILLNVIIIELLFCV
jgi:hypothetical protein